MKTLNQIHFQPQTKEITLYFSENVFKGSKQLDTSTFSRVENEGIAGALAWLQGIAEANGFTKIESVWVRRGKPLQTNEDEENPTFAQRLELDIIGTNETGLHGTVTVLSNVGDATNTVIDVFNSFESSINV